MELSPKLFLLVGEGVDGIYPLPEELKRRVDSVSYTHLETGDLVSGSRMRSAEHLLSDYAAFIAAS